MEGGDEKDERGNEGNFYWKHDFLPQWKEECEKRDDFFFLTIHSFSREQIISFPGLETSALCDVTKVTHFNHDLRTSSFLVKGAERMQILCTLTFGG